MLSQVISSSHTFKMLNVKPLKQCVDWMWSVSAYVVYEYGMCVCGVCVCVVCECGVGVFASSV